MGISISGDYAYIVAIEIDLRVFSVSDPESPEEVGFYETVGHAGKISVADDYAYVVDPYWGLRIISVTCPNSLIHS